MPPPTDPIPVLTTIVRSKRCLQTSWRPSPIPRAMFLRSVTEVGLSSEVRIHARERTETRKETASIRVVATTENHWTSQPPRLKALNSTTDEPAGGLLFASRSCSLRTSEGRDERE